ncbi:hypothetical protein K4K59_006246 [Colletotrichum sp. SAR11_240]|nr:hypothetical protein K4K59_006246 [Colletotrichum sp. SAR11_240]
MATSAAAPEFDNLSAILEFRVKNTWRVYDQGKHEEAEDMAAKLLMEPSLSSVHQACMHLLLAGSPHEFVEHANEAVRLYTEVIDKNKNTATPHQLACMNKMLDAAKDALRQARTDKSSIDREVAKVLAAGKTMTDLHDDQMKELQKFEDDQFAEAQAFAQGGDLPGGVSGSGVGGGDAGGGGAGGGGGNKDSQEAFLASSQSAPETTAGTSQGSALGRSQSTAATDIEDYDMGQGTEPLPPIYSSDEEMT